MTAQPPENRPFDAVLLIAFGGPRGPDDIRPFLANVLRGRRISPERLEEVAHHYELFGGTSPLTELTYRQATGLSERLARQSRPLPVYVGMRNWHPFLTDTMREMALAGVRRAVGFIMAPHRSFSSCGQYRQNVADAQATLLARGGRPVEVTYVGDWHTHPQFIEANARNIRAALERLPANLAGCARLVFTAHSLPAEMPGAAEYARQVTESARLAAAAIGLIDWTVAFQSRSGRPEDRWLKPDVSDCLRQYREELDAVVLSPIGFVADHVEVLYDLDREAMSLCSALGLPAARAASVNDDPLCLDMMADVVRATVDRYEKGRPLPIVSGVSSRLNPLGSGPGHES